MDSDEERRTAAAMRNILPPDTTEEEEEEGSEPQPDEELGTDAVERDSNEEPQNERRVSFTKDTKQADNNDDANTKLAPRPTIAKAVEMNDVQVDGVAIIQLEQQQDISRCTSKPGAYHVAHPDAELGLASSSTTRSPAPYNRSSTGSGSGTRCHPDDASVILIPTASVVQESDYFSNELVQASPMEVPASAPTDANVKEFPGDAVWIGRKRARMYAMLVLILVVGLATGLSVALIKDDGDDVLTSRPPAQFSPPPADDNGKDNNGGRDDEGGKDKDGSGGGGGELEGEENIDSIVFIVDATVPTTAPIVRLEPSSRPSNKDEDEEDDGPESTDEEEVDDNDRL